MAFPPYSLVPPYFSGAPLPSGASYNPVPPYLWPQNNPGVPFSAPGNYPVAPVEDGWTGWYAHGRQGHSVVRPPDSYPDQFVQGGCHLRGPEDCPKDLEFGDLFEKYIDQHGRHRYIHWKRDPEGELGTQTKDKRSSHMRSNHKQKPYIPTPKAKAAVPEAQDTWISMRLTTETNKKVTLSVTGTRDCIKEWKQKVGKAVVVRDVSACSYNIIIEAKPANGKLKLTDNKRQCFVKEKGTTLCEVCLTNGALMILGKSGKVTNKWLNHQILEKLRTKATESVTTDGNRKWEISFAGEASI